MAGSVTGKPYSYITVLSTDSYVEGVVVLDRSLARSQARYPFLVLTTPNLASKTLQMLDRYGIQHQAIPPIELDTAVQQHQSRWQWTYSKLQIFNQTQFEKLVYLDADMLVYENLDDLFERPHMSAVNAGGMLPEYANWTEFNSGLMVIEPAAALYQDMLAKLPTLYLPAGGDQDFLNAYYPDWPTQPEKHLDHAYNIFHDHVDRYQQRFGYELGGQRKPIKVIHYVGEQKPWLIKDALMAQPPWQMALAQVKDGLRYVVRRVRKVAPSPIQTKLPPAIGQRLRQKSLYHWLQVYQA